jgi:ankyrin repeat protein
MLCSPSNAFHLLKVRSFRHKYLAIMSFSTININGEEYMPRPHEVFPQLGEDMVWHAPLASGVFMSDPNWYDALEQDQITQRRIWAIPEESSQIDQIRQLLYEFPDRGLDMMFASAVKRKPHVVRFLVQQGAKATASVEDDDDMSLVPLSAAAYQGCLECVKILVEEGNLKVDTLDDMGGTPLMRACWGKHPSIVEYLLEGGADIATRQYATPEQDPGVNAFEFASGSGCVECARLIAKRADQMAIPASDLATPLALAAAASSNEIEMLELVLELGGYPRQGQFGNWDKDNPLTEEKKEAIEGAFQRSLQQYQYKILKALFTYIDSRNDNDEYQWTALKAKTVKALTEALLITAEYDKYQETFEFIFDVIIAQDSRFTTPNIQSKKDGILNDAFFWACRGGSMNMLKLIESKHESLDVNHLAPEGEPSTATPLYIAAALGHYSIAEYLLTKHREELNIHVSNGEYANGATAMWAAVWHGHTNIVKLLLERGGPFDYIDDTAKPISQSLRVVITATMSYRLPVKMVSEANWVKENGQLNDTDEKGKTKNEDKNEMHYVVMKLEQIDAAWWDQLHIRKNDEELLSMEKTGRPLQANPRTGGL